MPNMDQLNLISNIPENSGDLLISILPMHAKRIYAGKKTFELRKVLPREIPHRIFLYETERKKITGHIIVESVISGRPETIWKRTRERGTTRTRFFQYFGDRPVAHAFKIAKAVKYKSPISPDTLGLFANGFFSPQNFLYLEKFPSLRTALHRHAFNEVLTLINKPFLLSRLSSANRKAFVRMTQRHISGSYLETGSAYARKLIQVHSTPSDVEGILSLGKTILEVRVSKNLIGFCVLTDKIGGSIKTGPTLLKEKYRSVGVGSKLRQQLHKALSAVGYRKVYCTAPTNNEAAVGYLLASGYRIEAHLIKHYHNKHDEFVFGFPLTTTRTVRLDNMRPVVPAQKFFKLRTESASASDFLQNAFNECLCKMPPGWAFRQIKEAIQPVPRRSKFKPRLIFLALGDLEIQAAALCVHKRGGSMKLLIVSRTSHVETLRNLINKAEVETQKEVQTRYRKLYTFVPSTDSALQSAFYAQGYYAEGILDRPYRASEDLVILARFINSRPNPAPI